MASTGITKRGKSYQGWVWDTRANRKVRKSFPTEAAAKAWRSDAISAMNKGAFQAPSKVTLRQEAERWVEEARAGIVLNRSHARYKPSVLREIERSLKLHVLDDLGAQKVTAIRRRDIQTLVDRLTAKGLSGGTVRNVVNALRVVYRRALELDDLTVNPTQGLRLPATAGRRERAADPAEITELLGALKPADRPLWATAAYAGLRRGELQALRWDDVDLDSNLIHVRRGWDRHEGPIEPKSSKGTRRVPVATALRLILLEHKAGTGRRGDDLVFGSTATTPFTPSNIVKRANRAWRIENEKRKKEQRPVLVPICLHELRHSYVSMLFAAGFSQEEVGDQVGHTSAYITERYRHLLPGHEEKAAQRFDAYLTGSLAGARTLKAV
jgi:integrase